MALNDVERWQDWLGQINNDLSAVYLYRAIWTIMAQTIDGNLTIPRTPVVGMIASNYATSQAVAVRRLADRGKDAISFARLLIEIIASPAALTARSALPAGEMVDILAWERRFAAGVPGGHVDPTLLERDLVALAAAAESIKKHVDRTVAHRDKRGLATMPTFMDLNEAIDHLGELSRKCELLLHMADRLPMPVVLGDVMDAFSVPWVPAKPRMPRPVPSGTPGT
jgi:hypothetical protein